MLLKTHVKATASLLVLGIHGQRCVALVRADGGVATGRAQCAQQEAGQAVVIFGKVAILRGRTGRFWERGPSE